MIEIKLKEAKGQFFDERKILDPVERATLKALSKFGSFVRRRAKSSIRQRKRVSDPGSPPSSHTGLLKQFIFFFVEKEQKNVVIGPIQLNKSLGDAPRLLEYGGDAVQRRFGVIGGSVEEIMSPHGYLIEHHKKVMGFVERRMHYRPRPFMQPAFDAEIPKAAELLRGEVK